MTIDIQILRKKIRTNLETEELLSLLDRAVELIPQERLPELIVNFFDLDSLSLVDETSNQFLIDEVRNFYEESIAGIYYEDFRVNSRNFMDSSRGTINFIAEFRRLMQRCIDESESGNSVQVLEAFDLLINLLDEIDQCRDDIIFFADEGGAWQVGVDWNRVLPCYFRPLAVVAKPKEYAQRAIELVKEHADYQSDQCLQEALKIATPSQKKALKALM